MTQELSGNRCLCRGCGEVFNSVGAFDKHQTVTGGFRCFTIDEMQAKGMIKNAKGYWITAEYTGPSYADLKQRQKTA